eukprot:gene11907-biopygen5030
MGRGLCVDLVSGYRVGVEIGTVATAAYEGLGLVWGPTRPSSHRTIATCLIVQDWQKTDEDLLFFEATTWKKEASESARVVAHLR